MIDVTHQISAVRRQLGTRVLEAGVARVLTMSQSYATTPDDLWNACTDADRIKRWFLPVSGDLAVGGRYQIEGNAGGTIERCDRPKSFAATWEFGGEISWIEVSLSPGRDDQTAARARRARRRHALGRVRTRCRGHWLGRGVHGAGQSPIARRRNRRPAGGRGMDGLRGRQVVHDAELRSLA
jgi:uncharacterized protein YndB with AHSA1/START domain